MDQVLLKWLHEALKKQLASGCSVFVGGKRLMVDFDGECVALWETPDEDAEGEAEGTESKQLARVRLVPENPAED